MFTRLVAALPTELEFHSVVYLEHSFESAENEAAVRSVVDLGDLADFPLTESLDIEEQHASASHLVVWINFKPIAFCHRLFEKSFMLAPLARLYTEYFDLAVLRSQKKKQIV